VSRGGRESRDGDESKEWMSVGRVVGLANGVRCRMSWDSCGLSMAVGKGRL